MDTVAVTGGSGRVGSTLVRTLSERGYRVVNVDRVEGAGDADRFLEADLLDAGEAYGALARADPDAVAHFGTSPSPRGFPEHVTYASNATTTYHVLEASAALGVESMALASSIQALGRVAGERPVDVRYLPVDESHPHAADDPYALGKQTVELLAGGFARRPDGPDRLATLRLSGVQTDEGLAGYPSDPRGGGRDVLFSYVHVADVAEFAARCLEADFEGHETFFVAAPDTRCAVPSADLAREFYPDADRRRELSGHESLVSQRKAREVLGWAPGRSWRP